MNFPKFMVNHLISFCQLFYRLPQSNQYSSNSGLQLLSGPAPGREALKASSIPVPLGDFPLGTLPCDSSTVPLWLVRSGAWLLTRDEHLGSKADLQEDGLGESLFLCMLIHKKINFHIIPVSQREASHSHHARLGQGPFWRDLRLLKIQFISQRNAEVKSYQLWKTNCTHCTMGQPAFHILY